LSHPVDANQETAIALANTPQPKIKGTGTTPSLSEAYHLENMVDARPAF
jgi:hypothetical protein